MLLGFALIQVTSFTVEIWILDYLWGKNITFIFKFDGLHSDLVK